MCCVNAEGGPTKIDHSYSHSSSSRWEVKTVFRLSAAPLILPLVFFSLLWLVAKLGYKVCSVTFVTDNLTESAPKQLPSWNTFSLFFPVPLNKRLIFLHECKFCCAFIAVASQITSPPRNDEIQNGSMHVLRCNAAIGFPTPAITWEFQHSGQSLFQTVKGPLPGPTSTFTIQNAQVQNVGVYRCTATNVLATVQSQASIEVTGRICNIN